MKGAARRRPPSSFLDGYGLMPFAVVQHYFFRSSFQMPWECVAAYRMWSQ
jgi:hypothetical protein